MKEYIRMMKSFDRENISVFLGAGASVQSQIPSAKDLVWQFKRTLGRFGKFECDFIVRGTDMQYAYIQVATQSL